MKTTRPTRKLTLTTETIAHLRQLSARELHDARGGMLVAGTDWCTAGTKCAPIDRE